MVRRILVPLDPSEYAKAALEYSCFVAKHTDAEITGLTVLDVPGIEKSVGAVPLGGIYYAQKIIEERQQEAVDHIKVLVDEFEAKCRREGVKHRLSGYQGSPSKRIAEVSIYFDMVVMGLRTFYHFETSETPGDSLEEVLDRTITPVAAVPAGFKPPEGNFKILIAFDGSPPSARAVHCFTQQSDVARFDVTVLMSHNDMDTAQFQLERIARYLRTHSFEDVKTKWTPQNIIKAVDEQYLDDVDGVVLGVHSKKGLFDFRLGSLSRHLIERDDKLLLLGQ